MIAQIALAEVEVFGGVFGNDLEFIVLWHVDDIAHGVVDDFADRLSILHGLTLHEVDANKRHDAVSCGSGSYSALRRSIGIDAGGGKRHADHPGPRPVQAYRVQSW